MKKVEYIEKYGEEAWKIKAQKQKEYREAWENKNPEKVKESRRKYEREHAKVIYERKKEQLKKYREKNRERIAVYFKEYYQKNKERLNNNSSKYQVDNREKINSRRKEYAKTKRGRAQSLRHTYTEKDKAKGFDPSNNITQKWIVENIFSGQACIYCGDNDWTHLGCDRIDNNKPHTPDNVVCSCFVCNSTRTDIFTVEEFKKYRSLHPRTCDIPKESLELLNENGALKKRPI